MLAGGGAIAAPLTPRAAQTPESSPAPPTADPTPDPNPRSGLLSRAQSALRAERYSEAEALWLELAHQWPDSAEISYSLGLTFHRQFKIEAAAEAYITATVLNPNHREAQINLSLARIQLGQLEEALLPLAHVLALPDRPSSPASIHTLAHYNQAVIFGRQSKLEEARQEVDKALAITPSFEQARELIELIR
ncbi:MAG: tetratricopeptide repeat protein [Synechococcales cyanobacterium RM1_1_8]|nr:tetratricopeptide repeat protein [Synechococcales cyanobacterium RM1_1_8]